MYAYTGKVALYSAPVSSQNNLLYFIVNPDFQQWLQLKNQE